MLYVGNLREGGNSLDRVVSLRGAGWDVEGIDTWPYRAAGPRLIRSLTSRWQIGPPVKRLNRDLCARAAQGGYDVVLVDKGTVVWSETMLALKAGAARNLAVHYTPDAAFFDNRSREFFRAIPEYDLLVTTKPFECNHYLRAGARELMLIEQGYGNRIDPALAAVVPDSLRSEVVFVGHCQPHYARLLKSASESLPLKIWGPGWPEYAARNTWARGVVQGPGLFGPDYARALGGAKIALGLLSKRVAETTTTRSFEIPAMGTMLLAERSHDHCRLFEEGREAEFFDDAEEMIAKARAYLADDAARRAVGAAGRARCLRDRYAMGDQIARITDWLDNNATRSFNNTKPAKPLRHRP